jgi:hypothetical protein
MTDVGYSDIRALSPSGRLRLEARSPHNGTITHRNGSPVDAACHQHANRVFQSDFRYQLIDAADDRVIWERWQAKEKSPHHILVSDDGWSVLHLHGFIPEIVVVSPKGQDTLHFMITSPADPLCTRYVVPEPRPIFWIANHLSDTTAGAFWTGGSWPCFFTHAQRTLFSWRTSWGQRMIIDLNRNTLISDQEQAADPSLEHAVATQESHEALRLLEFLTQEMPEAITCITRRHGSPDPAICEKIAGLIPAINLMGVHRVNASLPLLRAWEALDLPSSFSLNDALSGYSLEDQYLRPILHQTFCRLGEQPLGYSNYNFINRNHERLQIPERLTDRAQRATKIKESMKPSKILLLLGAPDYMESNFFQTSDSWKRTEHWEYDHPQNDGWSTLRIHFETQGQGWRLTSIAQVPALWLTDECRTRRLTSY